MIMVKNIHKSLSQIAEVFVAFSSQEAILILDKNICDLIVLEPVVHGNNGIEFLNELRSYNDWQQIPVIVFSTSEKPAANESLSQLGVVDWLPKQKTTLDQLTKIIQGISK